MKLVLCKGLSQVRELVATESPHRLLDQVMEQLLHKGCMGLFAVGQVRRQAAHAVEFDRLALAGAVNAP